MLLMAATLLPAMGCLSQAGPGGTSGGLADLIPGHKDAELRRQVEADNFPTADRALGTPVVGNDNRNSSGN